MAYDADSGDGTVYEHNYSRMDSVPFFIFVYILDSEICAEIHNLYL